MRAASSKVSRFPTFFAPLTLPRGSAVASNTRRPTSHIRHSASQPLPLPPNGVLRCKTLVSPDLTHRSRSLALTRRPLGPFRRTHLSRSILRRELPGADLVTPDRFQHVWRHAAGLPPRQKGKCGPLYMAKRHDRARHRCAPRLSPPHLPGPLNSIFDEHRVTITPRMHAGGRAGRNVGSARRRAVYSSRRPIIGVVPMTTRPHANSRADRNPRRPNRGHLTDPPRYASELNPPANGIRHRFSSKKHTAR